MGAAALAVITSLVYWAGYAAEDKRLQKREAKGKEDPLRFHGVDGHGTAVFQHLQSEMETGDEMGMSYDWVVV